MIISLNTRSDERGSLVAIEANRDVAFDIARVYYIFGTGTDVERGFHAHRELQQLMVCTSGACTVALDDGNSRKSYVLDDPSLALFVDRMTWREMSDFSSDAVLLVLASHHYDREDYIRSYTAFQSERQHFISPS